MESNKKNQEHWIENIRAIAIIMVVFGHSIILYSSEWDLYSTIHEVIALDYIKRFINLIQMPLFFSLSGYCFRYTIKKETGIGGLAKKKFSRLIVPFLTTGLLWMMPIRILLDYPGWKNHTIGRVVISDIILGKDCGHLWYLPTLFLCFIILYLLVKTEQNSKHQKKRTHIIFAAAVFLVSLAAARGYSRLTAFTYLAWTAQYFLWFYLGYFLFEYKAEIRTMNPFIKVILTLAVFGIVLSALFFRNFIISAAASLGLIFAFYTIVPDKESRALKFISDNSFGIYLFHSPLIYITYTYLRNAAPVIVVGLNFFVFGIIAVIMTDVIRKTPLKKFIGG